MRTEAEILKKYIELETYRDNKMLFKDEKDEHDALFASGAIKLIRWLVEAEDHVLYEEII